MKDILIEKGEGITVSGMRINVEGVKIDTIPVPVTVDFDKSKKVGFATVHKKDNRMYADFHIPEPSDYDFLPQGYCMLYPAVGVNVLNKVGGEITECRLYEVSLCSTPNADSSIPPVKLFNGQWQPERMSVVPPADRYAPTYTSMQIAKGILSILFFCLFIAWLIHEFGKLF